jgi:hypothetical protein
MQGAPLPPAPGGFEQRLQRLEAQVAELTKTGTNSPKFWTRAFSMLGHQMAATGLIYAGFLAVFLVLSVAFAAAD